MWHFKTVTNLGQTSKLLVIKKFVTIYLYSKLRLQYITWRENGRDYWIIQGWRATHSTSSRKAPLCMDIPTSTTFVLNFSLREGQQQFYKRLRTPHYNYNAKWIPDYNNFCKIFEAENIVNSKPWITVVEFEADVALKYHKLATIWNPRGRDSVIIKCTSLTAKITTPNKLNSYLLFQALLILRMITTTGNRCFKLKIALMNFHR